jgi:hypothetical protein
MMKNFQYIEIFMQILYTIVTTDIYRKMFIKML